VADRDSTSWVRVMGLVASSVTKPHQPVLALPSSGALQAGFEKVVNCIVGRERLSRFDVVMVGWLR